MSKIGVIKIGVIGVLSVKIMSYTIIANPKVIDSNNIARTSDQYLYLKSDFQVHLDTRLPCGKLFRYMS